MNCPKCNSPIEENATVCPHCKKVLALVCPRCGALNEASDCTSCGYSILSKCCECGVLNKTEDKFCKKCKTSTLLSACKRFTDSDSIISLTITIGNVGKLSKTLGSRSLYSKFLFKIKSLIFNFAKEVNAHSQMVDDSSYILTFLDEGSEYSSAQKAVKSGIKLLNIICNLNRSLKKELMFSLEVKFSVERKEPEDFFNLLQSSDKIKLLDLYTEQSKDFKGLQFIADEYVYKLLRKEYRMESLYSAERKGNVISYYSLSVADYMVPVKKEEDEKDVLSASPVKIVTKKETDYEQELYKKSIEGIKVNCKFEQFGADEALEFLRKMNFSSGNRIISIRGDADRQLPTEFVIESVSDNIQSYVVVCTEEVGQTPWKFFKDLLCSLGELDLPLGVQKKNLLNSLKTMTPPQYDSAEEARLAYIELFLELLCSLPRSVIYIENFEHIDIASKCVLEEIFCKIDKTKLSFVITNARGYALQKQMPDLLNSLYYTELFLGEMNTEVSVKQILDSEDFRQSFYYKKILDNAGSSYQYCVQSINYLMDCGVILDFNGKVVLTESKTVILPFSLETLINTRLKRMSKDAGMSLILAYSYLLGPVIEFSALERLGLNNKDNISALEKSGFLINQGTRILIQNYEILKKSFSSTLKPDVLKYLASNILTKVFSGGEREYAVITALSYLGNVSLEFSKLYEYSIVTLQFGDYDSYLKMCIKLLKLLSELSKDVSADEINEYQADFYNNLTQLLYRYAPERIYPIAESLLQTATENNDSEKIRTLSNMMLQGGLLTSNYTNAMVLIQNILERTENCSLNFKEGVVNYKVFALNLVSIEIYFYLGHYDKCISVCEDILAAVSPEKLEELKPAVFSEVQYKSHLSESFMYYLLSQFMLGDNLEACIIKLENSLGFIPDGAFELMSLSKALQGDIPQVLTECDDDDNQIANLYAKLINALVCFNGDYSLFATQVYEFKKISIAQNKQPFVLLADLLIAFSYKSMDSLGKAEHIYNNVYSKAKQQSLVFLIHLSSYLLADLNCAKGDFQQALQAITNSITVLERFSRPPVFLLYLLKKKLVDIVNLQGYTNIDISPENGYINQFEQKYKGFSSIMRV